MNDSITIKTKFIPDDRGDGLTLKDRSIMIVPEDFEDFDHAKQPNKDYYSYFSSISSSIDVSGRVLQQLTETDQALNSNYPHMKQV